MGRIYSYDENNRVKDVVHRVVGEDRLDPYAWVVSSVKERLVKHDCLVRKVGYKWGWFLRRKTIHWSANYEVIMPLTGEAKTLEHSLRIFAAKKPILHKRLVKEVTAGIIKSRVDCDVS